MLSVVLAPSVRQQRFLFSLDYDFLEMSRLLMCVRSLTLVVAADRPVFSPSGRRFSYWYAPFAGPLLHEEHLIVSLSSLSGV